MPKEFWAEAVDCAIYLANRSPTKSVKNKMPIEAWSGRKPGISHLRVFESVPYAHVPDQKRTKLDDKSEKLIFVGYDSSSKGYKLYNPKTGKVISGRDVVFDEEATWDWNVPEEENYDFLPYPFESTIRNEEYLEVQEPSSTPSLHSPHTLTTPNEATPTSGGE